MNNRKLIRDLDIAFRVRCKFWSTCGANHCQHYEPHHATESCMFGSPVKYCQVAKGFVHDIPYHHGMYAEDECDPNLAFKAKRDAERRNGGLVGFDSNVELTTDTGGKYITTHDGMVDVTAMGDDNEV